MSHRTVRTVALIMLLALLLPLVAACGGGNSGGNAAAPTQSGQEQQPPAAQPTDAPAAEEPTEAPSAGEPSSGPAPQSTDPSTRVTEALGRLTSDDPAEAAFSSYHIEVNMASPSWDSQDEAVVVDTTTLSADVEGANVHLMNVEEEDGSTSDTYIIGETEYTVANGEVTEVMIPMGALTWATWQLTPVVLLSIAGLGASPAGSEAVDGRTADVYTVDMANADAATLEMVQGFIGDGITAASGKVWIDQETGALLKTALDWEEDVKAFGSDEVAGHESGHLEIEVSQVDAVSVSDPSA